MDSKSLEVLEFPKVRELLAGLTSFSASRTLVLEITPSTDPAAIVLLLQQSAEARRLLSLQPGFSIGDVSDVRGMVHAASKGGTLEPLGFAALLNTLSAARVLRATLGSLAKETPSLWELAGQIAAIPELEYEIKKAISPSGDVLDTASEKLAELRYRARDARQRLLKRLEGIIESSEGQRVLQEPIITDRGDRYVIPVKMEMRQEVKGIVHDISRSGASVFIEPMETLDLGNELREVVVEEAHEVERVLASLSAQAGRYQQEMTRNIEVIADLDLALAKARYAQQAHAAEPAVAPARSGSRLKLVAARHPLLKGKVVPLDLEIGDEHTGLIITGPNTGGKTVALKTVGLLTAMAQAGMPIPASETSSIPIFDGIFADIGDEQSIEQTLSTFSWHMGNIIRIVKESTGNSLILLDELGVSTDPGEGAALARSILLHLKDKGALIVATTHYGELKAFAHRTPGFQNASLDFDPLTLAPTYHLTIGVPGGSNAIATAARLGLPPEIIAAARAMQGQGDQALESLLHDLAEEREKLAFLRGELEREKAQAEERSRRLAQELTSLELRRRAVIEETRDELLKQSAQLRHQIRSAESELKKEHTRQRIEEARQALAAVQQELAGARWQGDGDKKEASAAMAPGDKVWLKDLRRWGNVISASPERGRVDVQVGQARMTVDVEDVGKAAPAAEPAPAAPTPKSPRKRSAAGQLDLRGKRFDDAEAELDRYLNDAFMAQIDEVRIVHGIGTGALRQMVRQMLSTHPLVKSFRPADREEGGEGATLASL